MRVDAVIIGAGVAGLAAAFASRRDKGRSVIVDGGAGASALSGGAIDDQHWDRWLESADQLQTDLLTPPLPNQVREFARELGLWHLPPEGVSPPMLATRAGAVRPSVGCDRWLLDLSQLPDGATVVLPRVDRAEWDADSLARSLSDDPLASERGLRFEAVNAVVLRYADEKTMSEAELATRHNEPGRAGWLGDQLKTMVDARRAAQRRTDAILLGGWLGTLADPHGLGTIRERAGVLVGEVLTAVGGAAGLRFESARDQMLGRLGVELIQDFAKRLSRNAAGFELDLTDSARPLSSLRRVTLATGGLAAGGLALTPPGRRDDTRVVETSAFRLALDTDLDFEIAPEATASRHGPVLDDCAWPRHDQPGLLEQVGVRSDALPPGVRVVGDLCADRPRTMLSAIRSGLG